MADTQKLTLTNTQKGPRGVNSVGGPVTLDPGETAEVTVPVAELEHIEATGWFTIGKAAAKKLAQETDEERAAREKAEADAAAKAKAEADAKAQAEADAKAAADAEARAKTAKK